MNKLFTEAELAAELGISSWTVRRWRLNESLPVCKISGRFMYRMESVLKWLEGLETTGAADSDEQDQVGVIRAIAE